MRQRDRRRSVQLEPAPDRVAEVRDAEQPLRAQAADDEDQLRADELELPLAPVGAELLLPRRRGPVAAPARRLPGIAAGDGGAVEGCVEVLLVQLEPATERPAGAAAPRQPLLALDGARRLPVDVRTLAGVRLDHRPGFEGVPGLDARAADAVVALEGGDRPVRRPAPGHGEATITTSSRPTRRASARKRTRSSSSRWQ